MLQTVTDDNFKTEVIESDIPCVIGFTAGWCTMCDEMAPIYEELAEELDGKIKFCMVNVDEQKGLRISFAVAAMPYIVYVHDGKRTPLFDAITPKEKLKERIQYLLDGGEAPNTTPLPARLL